MSTNCGFDSQANEERFITMALRYLDGESSDKEIRELQELLRVSAPHRDLFITISRQDSELQELFAYEIEDFPSDNSVSCNGLTGPQNAADIPLLDNWFTVDDGNILDGLEGTCQCEVEQPPQDEISIPVWLFQLLGSPVPLAVMLFCVLLAPLAVITWVIWSGNAHQAPFLPDPTSGRVSQAVACVWNETKGTTLSDGGLVVNHERYLLESGILQIDLNSGVQAIIEGPATFSTDSSMRLTLTEGRIAAKVPPRARNFTVITPGLEVIDRGTSFGVEIDDRSNADIHVFEGYVDAATQDLISKKSVKSLGMKAGQATSIDLSAGTFEDCPLDQSRFIREVSTDTGLLTRLANPSFETPHIIETETAFNRSGNLHLESIPGWKMSNNVIPFKTVTLQRAPFSATKWPYNLNASDGEQVLKMQLYHSSIDTNGGVSYAWAYQFIGIPTPSDVGKTFTLEADVAMQPPANQKFDEEHFFVAKAAFATAITPYQPGEEIGRVGVMTEFPLDGKNSTVSANITIGSHMVGQKLFVRLSLQNTSIFGRNGVFHFDRINMRTNEPY